MQEAASRVVGHVDVDTVFNQRRSNAVLTTRQCKVQRQIAVAVKFIQLPGQLQQNSTD